MPRKKADTTRQEAMRILANAIIWLGGNGKGEYKGTNDCDAMSKAYAALSQAIKGFGEQVEWQKGRGKEDERDTSQSTVSP